MVVVWEDIVLSNLHNGMTLLILKTGFGMNLSHRFICFALVLKKYCRFAYTIFQLLENLPLKFYTLVFIVLVRICLKCGQWETFCWIHFFMHCFFFFPLFDNVYLFVADEHIFSCVTDILIIVFVFSNLV